MKSLINHQGFSLVELMTVVGIIGVLSAIAIPQYNNYSARARQSEAKIGLAGIYTAEQSFFAESATYSGCLSNIGFSVVNTSNNYYAIGFKDIGITVGPGNSVCTAGAGVNYFGAGKKIAGTAPTNPIAGTTTATSFTGSASGNINGNITGSWTMDQNKTLSNSAAGI